MFNFVRNIIVALIIVATVIWIPIAAVVVVPVIAIMYWLQRIAGPSVSS